MSTDTDNYVVVGFVIDVQCFFKPFFRARKEKWHMEDRFSPKTGKIVGQEKVVDVEAGCDVVFLDKVYAGPKSPDDYWCPDPREVDDVFVALEEHLDASLNVSGNYAEGGPFFVNVESGRLKTKEGVVDIAAAHDSLSDLKRIEKKLKKLGIDPGTCGVHVVTSTYG